MSKFGQLLVFLIAISFVVIGAFRSPLKDNQPWRRCLSVAVGLGAYVWAGVGIYQGPIRFWRTNTQAYVMKREPFDFWVVVSVIILLGSFFIYRGFRGAK